MSFPAVLCRSPSAGAWVFVEVPDDHAPDQAGAFGRTPVIATVDGTAWPTSVWRERTGRWLLPVPARLRPGKDEGDEVTVQIEPDPTRF